MYTNILNIEEFLKMTEGLSCLKGVIKITDVETGESIEKNNLVLLRTRLIVLLGLFKPDNVQELEERNGYIHNDNRKVCLFKIGSGGADVQATALQPFVPKFNDTDLAKPIPFIITSPDKYLDPDYEKNPSVFFPSTTEFDKKMRETYHCPVKNVDDTVYYYAKTFDDNSMRIIFNKEVNELYAHMTLSIDAIDSRGYSVNELGLLLAEQRYFKIDGDMNRVTEAGQEVSISVDEYNALQTGKENYILGYTDEELVTRVTFDTESLRSLSRKLLIEYRVYA